MKQIVFHILCSLSYVLRPLRHGFYKVLLQKAYEIQGVKFNGKIGYIHNDAYIDNVGNVELGNNIVISTKAVILAHDYSVLVKENVMGGHVEPIAYVKIGDNTFVGAGAIILPKTTIGNFCIIGAGAVVKGNIPDYSVVVGNPAKIIKSIKPKM